MMLYSAEIRWFFKGRMPIEILAWFQNGYSVADNKNKQVSTLESEEPRDDCYLLFAECDSVGVKLRENKKENKVNFEIKSLLTPPRPFIFNNIKGKTDQWIKWSATNTELAKMFEAGTSGERWIKVNKTRFLRKFAYEKELKEVWAETKPAEGCNIELTAIKVDNKLHDWYTIGFEAFGQPANLSLILTKTVAFFFASSSAIPNLEFDAFHSLSYPAWLVNL